MRSKAAQLNRRDAMNAEADQRAKRLERVELAPAFEPRSLRQRQRAGRTPNASRGLWTQCYVGKASSCTATGLVSGTQYWFHVRAIGAAGPSAWNDPATKRAT